MVIKLLRCIILLFVFVLYNQILYSQKNNFSVHIGADFPYQNYIGLGYEFNDYQVVLRTGLMPSSYSKTISDVLMKLNVSEQYTQVIDASFDKAWMNSIAGYYSFGKYCNLYLGPELRMDQVSFDQTGAELLEIVTGREVTSSFLQASSVFMNVELISIGSRLGYSIAIDNSQKHNLNFDFSLFKIIGIRSYITINDEQQSSLSSSFSNRLWDESLKNQGYFGGFGIAYKYCF